MGLIRMARHTPSAVLLLVQLMGVLLYPFLQGSIVGQLGFEGFSLVVLALAVYAVRATPGLTWVSILLGIPAFLTSVTAVFLPSPALIATTSLLHAMFYFYAAYSLIRYMTADNRVTTDELFATGATFTLVAWGFAYVFQFVQALRPLSFTAAVDADFPRSWFDLLFLSFTTLTSTGLSDIMPITPWSRSVVMFEQLAGVAFLAMIVSRLVTLSAARKQLVLDRGADPAADDVDPAEARTDSPDRQAVGPAAGGSGTLSS